MAKILDGRVVRDKIAEDLRSTISLRARGPLGRRPKLVILQIGDLPQSNTYIRQKILFGQKIGAIVEHIKLDQNIDQKSLISQLSTLNSQFSTHGVIVQLPIPENLDKDKIINTINPQKDVDGQTATNIKLLFEDSKNSVILGSKTTPESFNKIQDKSDSRQARMTTNQGYIPATTKGIFTLLDYYKIPIEGKHIVVIGRSSLVGKPTALLALNKNATVTICHSKTENLATITKSADILIVAAGKPKLITKEHISKNQVVIDVGINVIASDSEAISNQIATNSSSSRNDKTKPESEPSNHKLVGDVDFDSVKSIVAAISPVPGGVGPMTVASLFQNLLEAYK